MKPFLALFGALVSSTVLAQQTTVVATCGDPTPIGGPLTPGTSHFLTVDPNGEVCAATSTTAPSMSQLEPEEGTKR